jgi:hypothetical protein
MPRTDPRRSPRPGGPSPSTQSASAEHSCTAKSCPAAATPSIHQTPGFPLTACQSLSHAATTKTEQITNENGIERDRLNDTPPRG